MVTQNMMRTHEEKLVFSKERKYPICDCSRSSQMPKANQITDILTCAPYYEIPPFISTMAKTRTRGRMDLRPFCFRQENKFCIWPVIRYQFDQISRNDTLCPRSLIPLYIVSYHMKWVKTSWTYSIWPDIKYSIRPYPDIQTT